MKKSMRMAIVTADCDWVMRQALEIKNNFKCGEDIATKNKARLLASLASVDEAVKELRKQVDSL